MPKELIYKPELPDVLDALKQNILYGFNSQKIGIIEKFDATTMTAAIQLVDKVSQGDNLVARALLVNCPVEMPIASQGGLTIPIVQGDSCLVSFNDTDIDNWYNTGSTDSEPNTLRMHNINDGIARVGIKNKANVLTDYSAEHTKLSYLDTSLILDNLVELKNSQTDLKAVLEKVTNAFTALVGQGGASGAPIVLPTEIAAITTEINKLLK
jgi:hypothetical protein